jgi:hypothetical protein
VKYKISKMVMQNLNFCNFTVPPATTTTVDSTPCPIAGLSREFPDQKGSKLYISKNLHKLYML